MRKLLDSDEYAFRFEIGVCDVSSEVKLSDRDRIVLSLANYFTVVVVKAYIDQIVDGLKVLGISELIKANPRTMHKLFCYPTCFTDFRLHVEPVYNKIFSRGSKQTGR